MPVGTRVHPEATTPRFPAAAVVVALATALAQGGCTSEAPSPFSSTGGGGAGGGPSGGGGIVADGGADGAGGGDPTLGGPCVDDAGCDDGADCTDDRCDLELGRCRFQPDATRCDDGVFCDGIEVCVPRVGCEPGPPHDCGDDDACTIDTCEEDTQTCSRRPRDADGDGDSDAHCPGGGDCDDLDPSRSSESPEVCGNGVDDDCDDETDESGCVAPPHDDCDDPLLVEPDATFTLSTIGASLDLGATCAPEGAAFDVVATLEVPDGPPRDVDVRAVAGLGQVGVALTSACGDPAAELACGGPASGPDGLPRARALARAVPPGELTLVLMAQAPELVALDVRLGPATTAPTHETCGTALDLTPGVPVEIDVVDAIQDVATACPRGTGELVYRVVLDAPADVDVHAISLDGLGSPSVSVRGAACAAPEDELACRTTPSAHVHRGAVEAGELFVALSASAPTRIRLVVEIAPPTPPAEDEDCDGAPPLTAGTSRTVELALHQDDHAPCVVGGVDAAYTLTSDESVDLLLVQTTAPGDTGGLALTEGGCAADDVVLCAPPVSRPVRLRRRGLAAGTRQVIVEGLTGAPQRLDVLARPAAPPTSVPFADGCEDALVVPPGGGFFVGNTAGASADLDAGCDDAGGAPGGAPDRLLRLDLTERSRVVLDAGGSAYRAMIDVRRGASCPGVEVPLGCTVDTGSTGAPFLDLVLDPDTYWIQIDGRSGDAGPFQLDVHTLPAP